MARKPGTLRKRHRPGDTRRRAVTRYADGRVGLLVPGQLHPWIEKALAQARSHGRPLEGLEALWRSGTPGRKGSGVTRELTALPGALEELRPVLADLLERLPVGFGGMQILKARTVLRRLDEAHTVAEGPMPVPCGHGAMRYPGGADGAGASDPGTGSGPADPDAEDTWVISVLSPMEPWIGEILAGDAEGDTEAMSAFRRAWEEAPRVRGGGGSSRRVEGGRDVMRVLARLTAELRNIGGAASEAEIRAAGVVLRRLRFSGALDGS